ncbi:uncharacterized protein LOC110039048 [Phalaenopsis equestris]|uniref:uncharacterized protein LOC110039048 n=1 Tax=Phalaenopsis equestris TaxID=78828 RepID=UPI0009E38F32|nr:uncharacterized protein LOC110039048 [Phalaenopsis equestris]
MEIASADVERSSEDKISLVDEGRKPPREAKDIRGRESIIFVCGLDLRTKSKQRGERNKIKQNKARNNSLISATKRLILKRLMPLNCWRKALHPICLLGRWAQIITA